MIEDKLEDFEPNRTGITIDGRTITVQGYNKVAGFQTFFDGKENVTSRVRGIDILDEHYLVLENDIDYQRQIPDHEDVSGVRKVYVLTDYNLTKSVAVGSEISHNHSPELLDNICLALAKRGNIR